MLDQRAFLIAMKLMGNVPPVVSVCRYWKIQTRLSSQRALDKVLRFKGNASTSAVTTRSSGPMKSAWCANDLKTSKIGQSKRLFGLSYYWCFLSSPLYLRDNGAVQAIGTDKQDLGTDSPQGFDEGTHLTKARLSRVVDHLHQHGVVCQFQPQI